MRESIFKSLLFRSSSEIGLFKWMRLTLLEAYLGEQLVEMFSVTSSSTERTNGSSSSGKWPGAKKPLEFFIPATFMNQKMENQIKDLLITKYLNHYEVIRQFHLDYRPDEEEHFEVNPSKLHMLAELKLAYGTIWVSLNIVIDIVVFIFTKDLAATVAVGAFLEFLRRFKW